MAAAGLVAWSVPRAWERARVAWLWHRCTSHAPPQDSPAFVYVGPFSGSRTAVSRVQPEWAALQGRIDSFPMQSVGTLFLGTRCATGGVDRLVAVDVSADFNLTWRVVEPPVSVHPPCISAVGYSRLPVPNLFRDVMAFEGQPDAADPSHFTINYVINGFRGTIDGWLQYDGRVIIEPRQPTPPDPTLPAPASPASLPTSAGSAPRPSAPPSAR